MRSTQFIFTLFSFCTSAAFGQRVSYSEPAGYFSHTHYKVIGNVGSHILTWEYFNNDYSTSQVSVYDDDLKLIRRVKFSKIKNPGLISVDFINERNSFDVIYQYLFKKEVFCKRATFNKDGECIRLQTLDKLRADQVNFNNDIYKVFQSQNRETYLLIKPVRTESLSEYSVKYIFFEKNLSPVYGTVDLPLDAGSISLTGSLLANNKNLFIASGDRGRINKLNLFKINPVTNTYSTITNTIKSGFFNMQSINISSTNENIYITAQWDDIETRGVFFWQPDITNLTAGSDTIYTLPDDIAFSLNKGSYFKTAVRVNNNVYNLLTTVQENFYVPFRTVNNQYISSSYSAAPSYAGSFYDGRVKTAPDPKSSSTINGVSTLNAYDERWQMPKPVNMQGPASVPVEVTNTFNKLIIWNIDRNYKVAWQTYLDSTAEENFFSTIRQAKNFFTNESLHIVYNKFDKKGVEMISMLDLDSKGGYDFKNVIVMKISYKYIFGGSVQLDDNSFIMPCVVNTKLAYIKIRL
jgi:hypothetical protein